MEGKTSEEDKRQLVEEIASLSEGVYEHFMLAYAEAWSKVDLTMLQFKVLAGVSLGDTVASPSLGRHFGISPSSLTRVVDQMVKRGLVRRLQDRSDRRVVRLQVTNEGRELVRALTKQAFPVSLREALYGLSDEDRLVLRDAAQIFGLAVQKARPAGAN